MRIACALIAGGHRAGLIERYILPNVLAQGFDEVLVVGASGSEPGVRYLDPEPIWKNTQDALMKRDLAALASESDVLV